MARRRHVIETALDFARMPALAQTSMLPPIPPDIVEVMRIAAGSPKACQDAANATGESPQALIEAARFYLQQLLFRPDADCRRVLGLQPDATRATARSHMRYLLQWLHPDRNHGLEAVYAERVVKAWREVSASSRSDAPASHFRNAPGGAQPRIAAFRLPWIKHSLNGSRYRGQSVYLTAATLAIPGLLFVLLALWSAAYFFGIGPVTAVVALP